MKLDRWSGGRARERTPTPIFVPPRVLAILVLLGVAALAYVLYAAPSILVIALGGTALAIVLSYPVRALSRVVPRGMAILMTFVAMIGLVVLALVFLVPLLVRQLRNFILIVPAIANNANEFLIGLIEPLAESGLLPIPAEDAVAGLVQDLFGRAMEIIEGYLGGLLFVVLIQGVLAGLALWILSVPYAILLGVWVSLTAIIPYLGAFLGGIPAVIVALVFGSPNFESSTTTAILTIVAYVLIQQLEGNFLTPRIQGQALQVHPILVLLAVIAGGELAGLAGIVFAVPTLAVFRVLFDFFRVRLRRR